MMTPSEQLRAIADRTQDEAGKAIEASASMLAQARVTGECDFEGVRLHQATAAALQAMAAILRESARTAAIEEARDAAERNGTQEEH